ncbi:MAG: Cof-type HAD-IIB family hydrolase [Lachnospiraceae bacterium]|nr:Cof-type HAD-IIB family hydrolase [Lachnospiraceae bacterium]
METIRLDAENMKTAAEAHSYLMEKLELPSYYGKNLDALYDVLCEREETRIVLEHTEQGGDYFAKVKRVLLDAARENGQLYVEEAQMPKKYRLIALDMDGTVLNDEKVMTERVEQSIHDALSCGIEVVFNSGRSLAEMEPFLKRFPDMSYLIGASGALVLDLKKDQVISLQAIDPEIIRELKEAAAGRDIIFHAFSEGRSYFGHDHVWKLTEHLMGPYAATLPDLSGQVEDLFDEILEKGMRTEKFNLYHTCTEERERTRAKLPGFTEKAELVNSEIASLEITAKGVNKGEGIRRLAEHLQIPVEETVMIGDADNDLAGLRAAGLAIGMGNCNENVRAVADRITADNNHDGCALAIEELVRAWKDQD